MRNLQSVGQLLLQCVVCFSTMGVGISQASNAVEKELSVPPMDFHEYPQGRPNWINVNDLEGREVAVTSARETQGRELNGYPFVAGIHSQSDQRSSCYKLGKSSEERRLEGKK